MARIVPFTNNREVVYDLLTRAKRYHCSVSGSYELDLTEMLAARKRSRAAGAPVSLTSCLVRATSLVIEKHPRLNHHLFHGLFRKVEVAFDGIHCNLIVMREAADGEKVLFPVVIRDANRLSLPEIEAVIRHHREAPLEDLPQVQAMERVKRLPRLALKWWSYKVRSDPRTYERYFGTYGLSSLVRRGWGATAAASLSNVATSFFPGTIMDRPVVVKGEVVARTVLHLLVVFDHYLVDGHDMLVSMDYLRELIEDPERLGMPGR